MYQVSRRSDRDRGQTTDGRGAIFVLPMRAAAHMGPVAAWVTTGGWASGAQEVLGAAWVVSDSGVMGPQEAMAQATRLSTSGGEPRRWRSLAPEVPITFLKDLRRGIVGRRVRCGGEEKVWADKRIMFVWQRHELFRRCGFVLAKQLGVPLVLSVHALQVEEASGWGVRRPGWGPVAERLGELPQLNKADLVACVSQGVADGVVRRGVPERRVLLTPNGVDTEHFRPASPDRKLRQQLGLAGKFVLVWSGSFRGFHGLYQALDAVHILEMEGLDISLLLIGDGLERRAIESRAAELGLQSVIFTGTVPYSDMPRYLNACDAGLVLSPPTGSMHYSPVKLREYMACGIPVIAHKAGEPSSILRDEHDALLVAPGDADALASATRRLRYSPELQARLRRNGRAIAKTKWSWANRTQDVLARLGV